MMFDRRKPQTILYSLNQGSKVNAVAWSPVAANLLCSVDEGGSACIWDLDECDASESEAPVSHIATTGHVERREAKATYSGGSSIFNVVWSQADPSFVSISYLTSLENLITS